MNTRNLTFRLGALALIATAGSVLFFAGCSGDDNATTNPTHLPDASADSKVQEDSGKDAKAEDGGKDGSKDGSKDSSTDGNNLSDVSLETSTSCKPDSSSCNSCYDDAQAAADPYNACGPYTKGCLPFTGTVPTHPMIP